MGIINDYRSARMGNKIARKNIEQLAIRQASKEYKDKTGNTMTSSRLRSDMDSIIVPKATKQYLDSRDSKIKEAKKKLRF